MKTIRALLFTVLMISVALPVPADTQKPENTATRQPTPSERLRAEHQTILMVVAAAKKEIASIRDSDNVNTKQVGRMLDFFSNYIEKSHYAKEERFYFPAAVYHNMDQVAEIVRQLRLEHDYSRSILEELTYAFEDDQYTTDFISERLEKYAEVIERIIAREDQVLFPKANTRIAGSEERALLKGFEKVEETELGSRSDQKYRKMAEEMKEALQEEK